MHIPSYQIRNILEVYSRQLSQDKILERPIDNINKIAEGKRQAIINDVTADIINKISRLDFHDEIDREILFQLQDESGRSPGFKSREKTEFVFNVIDRNNKKTTHTLSVEDPGFLIKRLEQLIKEAYGNNVEF